MYVCACVYNGRDDVTYKSVHLKLEVKVWKFGAEPVYVVVINFRLWEPLTTVHFLLGLSVLSSKNLCLNKSIMAISLLGVTTIVVFPVNSDSWEYSVK